MTWSFRDLRAITQSIQDPRAVTRRGGFNVRCSKSLLWQDKEPRNIHSRDIYGAWLGFNLAETTSARKRPGTAGAQLSEAPAVEAEGEENPVQGEAHHAGNQDSKK